MVWIVYYILNYWRDKMIRKVIQKLLNIFFRAKQVFFVGSTDILPEPLTKDMEQYYLELKAEGDVDAKNKLIEHNLRLVVFLAKKYENTNIDLEDLVSIGTIGLIKAINTYKMDKNIKLATYASRCIDNEILMFLRKNKRRRCEVSFEESLSFDMDGNELHLEDVLGTEPDIVTRELESEVEREMLIEEIEKLDPRDKKIMVLRYGLEKKEEMTQKDVAELLGISQSYISRIEKKVIRKLKSVVKAYKY
ncbi:MAG TPA: RNA polymerase sporulation sigma factor SigK [Mollicutes bacterium]|nr:RNA polymerase sporulation sigma factor SigK [Mollicutes bacterium]